jgi:hydroxymethylpyrimidine pyrophosphatase-like HAD family hydrolase
MRKLYCQITIELANRIRLIMTDVDGTLVFRGDSISTAVADAITSLQAQGIVVGLVSGRTLNELELLASYLSIKGPIIAENGGVAKIKAGDKLIDLGYSRQTALKSLKKLKALFPDAIREREDNKERLVDIVFWSDGVTTEELRSQIDGAQLLDSGYILHIMQEGISKGKTLMRLVQMIGNDNLSPENVMVFGDSLTDISLFELFPNSVLIINPRLPAEQRELVKKHVRYESNLPYDKGFVQVASHILKLRTGKV